MHFLVPVVASAITKANQIGDCCEVGGGVVESLCLQAFKSSTGASWWVLLARTVGYRMPLLVRQLAQWTVDDK